MISLLLGDKGGFIFVFLMPQKNQFLMKAAKRAFRPVDKKYRAVLLGNFGRTEELAEKKAKRRVKCRLS